MTNQILPHSPAILADIATRADMTVLEHLDRQATIPVINGMQAQGDLIVIPADLTPQVRPLPWGRFVEVRGAGVELLRSESGGNAHTLVADAGICEWNPLVDDPLRLAIGILDTEVTAYLIHPEHGATGIAPGRYVIRRQREGSGHTGFVLD